MKSCGQSTCPIFSKTKYPICKWFGNNQAKVVIIGDSPSFLDTKAGEIFSDAVSIEKLTKYLDLAGLTMDDVFFTSLTRCQVNKKDFPIQKERDAAVSCCVQFVERVIQQLKPKLVITMGEQATKLFAGKVKITSPDTHGVAVWSDKYSCWMYPVFSFGYIFRNEGKEAFVLKDFRNLKILVSSNYTQSSIVYEKPVKNYSELQTLAPTYDGKLKKGIALDTETQGLEWYNAPFICIGYSICGAEDTAHWITLFEECSREEADFHIKWNRVAPGGISKQKIPSLVFIKKASNFETKLKEMKFILEHPEIPKFFHHASYDLHSMAAAVSVGGYLLGWSKEQRVLKPQGVSLDTQFGAHVIDENLYTMISLEKLQEYMIHDEMPYNYNKEFGAAYDKSDMLAVLRDNRDDFVYYSCSDAEVAWRLARKQIKFFAQKGNEKLRRYVKEFGQPSIGVLTEMESTGFFVDAEAVPVAIESTQAQQAALGADIIKIMPPVIKQRYADDLRLSRDCVIRDVLFDKQGFGAPVLQKTGTTGEPSIGKNVRKLLMEKLDGDALKFVMAYHEYEALDTIRTRYLKSFITDVARDGFIHPSLTLTKAATGRSSSSPNLQNMPKRGKHAGQIRRMIIAPPGWEILRADESQAELRWAAELSGDEVMKSVFRKNGDIHITTGERLAGKPWDSLTKEEQDKYRQNAKPVNFGLLYLMSAKGFQLYAKLEYGLDLTIQQAEDMIRIYFETYPMLTDYHEKTIAFGERYGYVETPFGRRRRLPELRSHDKDIRSEAQRKAVNVPIQGASSDLVIIAGSELLKRGLPSNEIRLAMFIHDELVFYVKKGYAEKYAPMVKHAMEHPPLHKFGIKLSIPLRSDVSVGPNFYDCSDVLFDGYKYMGIKTKNK